MPLRKKMIKGSKTKEDEQINSATQFDCNREEEEFSTEDDDVNFSI